MRKSLAAKVNGLLRSQELKWYDTVVSSFSAGTVVPLNAVPLGDDAITRDGRKILMKSVQYKLAAFASQAAGLAPQPRLVIVYDKNPNALLPAVTDIFQSSVGVALTNLNNRERFEIIHDNYAGLKRGHDPLFVGAAGYVFQDEWFGRLDHSTVYGASGSGTQAGTQTGGLYAVLLGGSGDTNGLLNIRIRFIDS